MFNFNDSFFRPLWVRLLVVGVSVFWSVLEFATGSPGWAMMFAALALYSGYGLFITFDPKDDTEDEEQKDD